ncbi:MAG: hypothetical protein EXQ70_00675 [Solirubrobacterales bacterium]|nr:hypothetical protein [Solirubrobacterales bacterium]
MQKVKRSRGVLAVLAVVSALVLGVALPGAAIAQNTLNDPTSAQYDPDIPPSTSTEAGGGSGGADNIGSLPFTGMDLIILAGVALVLTGTGIALRRLSMPRGTRT